ncbi:MAG: AAA family ATPase [Bacilli bacterium]
MLAPLAYRMRPKFLHEVIGQEHLVGEHGFLTAAKERGLLVSIIFYGPSGAGKTTIAEAFANELHIRHRKLNAVTANKKDLETVIFEAKVNPPLLLILDEAHRLNKEKQDYLLPYIEDGTIYLLGATTANPYLAINPALRSRCHLLEVKPLNKRELLIGINRALTATNGLNQTVKMTQAAQEMLAKAAAGDLRFALNFLEVLSLTKKTVIDVEDLQSIARVPNFIGDQDENAHYDAVSALQKAIRGSDVDASLYYLARLIAIGDLESIRRRLLVTAYEDIGLANPGAVDRCKSALEAAHQLGFPEALYPLAFTVCDLALSPKSKAAGTSLHQALDLVRKQPLDVLDYLKLNPVNVRAEEQYPYDRPDLWAKIQYLPNLIKDLQFYTPSEGSQYERVLNQNYRNLSKRKRSNDLASLRKSKND